MLAEASLDKREVIRNSDGESHVERAATKCRELASQARGVDQKVRSTPYSTVDRVQVDR